MQINNLALGFQKFLLSCWPHIGKILEDLDWDGNPYFIDHWIQANWELLVEQQMGEDVVLPAYGYDPKPDARYTLKGKQPSHFIACESTGNPGFFSFVCFTKQNEEGFSLEPPLDTVCVKSVETGAMNYFQLETVRFSLVQM